MISSSHTNPDQGLGSGDNHVPGHQLGQALVCKSLVILLRQMSRPIAYALCVYAGGYDGVDPAFSHWKDVLKAMLEKAVALHCRLPLCAVTFQYCSDICELALITLAWLLGLL